MLVLKLLLDKYLVKYQRSSGKKAFSDTLIRSEIEVQIHNLLHAADNNYVADAGPYGEYPHQISSDSALNGELNEPIPSSVALSNPEIMQEM